MTIPKYNRVRARNGRKLATKSCTVWLGKRPPKLLLIQHVEKSWGTSQKISNGASI